MSDSPTVRPLRERRESMPVKYDLYASTSNPDVIAFHVAAALDVGNIPMTLPELGRRWKIGRPRARAARRELIDAGYWAEVRASSPNGTFRTEIRFHEDPMTAEDLAELALEYHSGSRIECGGAVYTVTKDGGISAGHTGRQNPVVRRDQGKRTERQGVVTTTERQNPVVRRDQGKRTERQNPAGRWNGSDAKAPGDKTPGRTERQNPAARKREREIPQGSLSTDRGEATPAPAGADASSPVEDAAVRELVLAFPWADYATRTGTQVDLSERDIATVSQAVAAVLAADRCTAEQAHRVASAALAKASSNPVRYVAGAFGPKLDTWLRSIELVAVFKPEPDSEPAADSAPAEGAGESPAELPDCAACGTRAGEPLTWRQSQDGIPCRECRPEAAAKAAPADPPRD